MPPGAITTARFQSTHLREVRQAATLSAKVAELVSIHAPARGATTKGIRASRLEEFQSTHLREVRRLASWITRSSLSSFNPRTCERCDVLHLH